MSIEDKKELVRKNGRRRRAVLNDEDKAVSSNGIAGIWNLWGKNLVQTLFFGSSIVLICFVGQEPPGLRTLGEVAPENVYSDRAFSYISEVRKRGGRMDKEQYPTGI